MKLVFATNNLNKLSEVKSLVRTNASVLSLDEIGCSDEIPETFPTIEENALQKAEYIYNKFGYNCFSDDSALSGFLLEAWSLFNRMQKQFGANKNIDKILKTSRQI